MSSLAFLEHLGDATDVSGVQITASATDDTMGSYTSLGTSTGAAAFVVLQVCTPLQGVSYLVDFAADEAGGTTYVDFCTDILVSCADSSTAPAQSFVAIPLPMAFASGTQFAARCQASTGSSTIDCSIVLYSGTTSFTVSQVQAMGANSADSRGVQVDPGATATSKGAYAELTSSASGAMDYLVPIIQSERTQTVHNGARIRVDIATGAAASEVVKVGDIPAIEHAFEARYTIDANYQVDIASGARVTARAISQSVTSGRRELDVVVLGFVKSGGGGGTDSQLWFAGE